jgi:hypothetical protein
VVVEAVAMLVAVKLNLNTLSSSNSTLDRSNNSTSKSSMHNKKSKAAKAISEKEGNHNMLIIINTANKNYY